GMRVRIAGDETAGLAHGGGERCIARGEFTDALRPCVEMAHLAGMPQRATAESPQARHEVQHQERRRRGGTQLSSAIDEPGDPRVTLDLFAESRRQEPRHFLDPWMEEFSDPEYLVIAGPRLATHPVESSRARL